MKEWGSKRELEQAKENLEGRTRERLDGAEENRREVEEASRLLDGQDSPAMRETADALNRIADEFAAEVDSEVGSQETTVRESVEEERSDVSDPAREGSDIEARASGNLEAGTEVSGRYAEQLADAGRERSEAAEFLSEVAEASESHQETSAEELEKLSEEARRAAEAIQRF